MLVLKGLADDRIYIGEDIVLTIIEVNRESVRLGFEAPRSIQIEREKFREQRNYHKNRIVVKEDTDNGKETAAPPETTFGTDKQDLARGAEQ